jgi:hypothetical protein
MKESKPRVEQEKFMEVVGDLGLTRKRLTAGFALAFFLANDFKVYVSSDNDHLGAAKLAGLPSNNSKGILIKGRISPGNSAFLFGQKGKSSEDFLREDVNPELTDKLIPLVVSALKSWLGKGFENYDTSYKKSFLEKFSGESIA